MRQFHKFYRTVVKYEGIMRQAIYTKKNGRGEGGGGKTAVHIIYMYELL